VERDSRWADMVGDLLLVHGELPAMLDELVLQPRHLHLVSSVPLSNLVPLPPHCCQIDAEVDRILPNLVEVGLEAGDAAEDLNSLVLEDVDLRLCTLELLQDVSVKVSILDGRWTYFLQCGVNNRCRRVRVGAAVTSEGDPTRGLVEDETDELVGVERRPAAGAVERRELSAESVERPAVAKETVELCLEMSDALAGSGELPSERDGARSSGLESVELGVDLDVRGGELGLELLNDELELVDLGEERGDGRVAFDARTPGGKLFVVIKSVQVSMVKTRHSRC
jgi:hypothetical protein